MQSLHPDFRTDTPDTEYFFLGSGKIQVAIQWSRDTSCTALGIILSHPHHFTRKHGSHLFHPEFGLERTMITVIIDGVRYQPTHDNLEVCWSEHDGVPNVLATWKAGDYTVLQSFYAPHETSTLMHRVAVLGAKNVKVEVEAALYANPTLFSSFGVGESFLYASGYDVLYLSSKQETRFNERFMSVTAEDFGEDAKKVHLIYVADTSTERVEIHTNFDREREYWERTSSVTSEKYKHLTDLFTASKLGLRAVVASNGRFDASIWQYGMEWGRDGAMVAEALIYSGQFELAKSVLTNILTKLTNNEGMIAEASRFRGGLDSELDSNGLVLRVLAIYAEWTGDTALLKEYSILITAIANYLLRDEFVDKETGMLIAARDIWERSEAMGIKNGYDVAHQTFAILGLEAASQISKYIGETEKSLTWENAAKKMRDSFLNHPTHSMIEDGIIIKRRSVDGAVQRTLAIKKKNDKYMSSLVPDAMPLGSKGEHHLEPDITQCFPIIYGLIDAKSDIALKTLAECEKLWSQAWDSGGYGRYDISGEPDSPGPWALATMFMASAQFEVGDKDKAMRSLEWLVKKAGASGAWKEFYGDRPTPPLPPTGILVWAWAQYIILIVKHILTTELGGETLTTNARLKGIRGQLRFRNTYIDLSH
ncbi:MAG TPA: hypothetical protein VIX80_07930 [Candidatus Kapabacteria bacterium]